MLRLISRGIWTGRRFISSQGSSGKGTYKLPPPTWSVSSLAISSERDHEDVVLHKDQLDRLCALAHIKLDAEGEGEFTADVVRRDVNAILRCARTIAGTVDETGAGNLASQPLPTPLSEDIICKEGSAEEVTEGASGRHGNYFAVPLIKGIKK